MEQSKIAIVNGISLFKTRKWLDERSFEAIFHEYYARIYSVAFRLVGDQDQADDLTAQTFIKLWESPPESDSNLAGWLYRVSTRLGYNALRSSRRRLQYESGAESERSNGNSSINPESEIERRYERQKVRKILREMPLRDVQVLILRHSGLAYREIAQALNVSPSSIGSMLARAERKFENLFQKGEPEDAPGR